MPDGDGHTSTRRSSASTTERGGILRTGGVRRSGGRRPSPYARLSTPMPVTFGQRSADRVTLAAGFVLGAGALLGFQAIRRALATIRDTARDITRP